MRVSVIVPHLSDLKGLDRCLGALERQTWPKDGFEVVVADNASPEGREAVEWAIAGRARLVVVGERGAGPARNGAVAASTGDVLAFIDSDCRAQPEWLAEGVKALSGHDFVGGRVKVLVDDPASTTAAEAFERVFAFDFDDLINRKGFAGTGNLFCPRAVFEAVGGFRAGVSEDVDWSGRARAAGFRLGYAPAAVVGHPARRTWPQLREKWRKTNLETYALMASAPGRRRRWLLLSLALPASILVHAPRVIFSDQLHGPRQRLSALAMLARVRLWRLGHALGLLAAREANGGWDRRRFTP
ncbi:MAG: glycosyltransferase family 2 protein [Caulobacteraceae bacterium]